MGTFYAAGIILNSHDPVMLEGPEAVGVSVYVYARMHVCADMCDSREKLLVMQLLSKLPISRQCLQQRSLEDTGLEEEKQWCVYDHIKMMTKWLKSKSVDSRARALPVTRHCVLKKMSGCFSSYTSCNNIYI